MGQPAYTRTAIQQVLRDYGPLSAAEITDILQMHRKTVNASIIKARQTHGTQFFRIVHWKLHTGSGGREIPIYDNGPGPDAKRPHFGPEAAARRQKRYVDKMRLVINARNRVRRGGSIPNPFQQLIKS